MLYQLGEYVKSKRIQKCLNRQQLAGKLGYNNTNKGARRIENAEAHGKIKNGLLHKLAIALDLDQTDVKIQIV